MVIANKLKLGEREHTMQEYFYKSSFFRQWLMRPDCPPLLQYCLKLLDKAYNFDKRDKVEGGDVEDEDDEDPSTWGASNPEYTAIKTPSSPELIQELGFDDLENFARIPGAKGHYAIPGTKGVGNSYVCFQPRYGTPDGRWVAGQIQHIFRNCNGGPMQVAIRRSQPSTIGSDPFASFWDDGFEAKLVSSKFSTRFDIINASDIIAHTARWTISEQSVVVLNLSRVRSKYDSSLDSNAFYRSKI